MEDASRLAHDVGKYIARTARNLPDGSLSNSIVDLFVEDLFQTDGKDSALTVFDRISAGPLEAVQKSRWLECRKLLLSIDEMRGDIKLRNMEAIRIAAALALRVEAKLCELVEELSGENR